MKSPCLECLTLVTCRLECEKDIISFLKWAIKKCPYFKKAYTENEKVDHGKIVELGKILGFSCTHSGNTTLVKKCKPSVMIGGNWNEQRITESDRRTRSISKRTSKPK